MSLVVAAGCGSPPVRNAHIPADAQGSPTAGVVASAEAALSGAAAGTWRPALRADLERCLQERGAIGPNGASSPARSLMNDVCTLSLVESAEPTERAEARVLVGPLAAATQAHRTLVVCREAEFDTLDDSVVVCLGHLRVRSARNSILFVLGRTEADEVHAVTLCGNGPLEARVARDTQVVPLDEAP